MVAAADDIVLTESYTYSGMLALSAQSGYRLHGVAMDAQGLIPENLDRAFAETGARVLYCMPTLQTPTGSVMPPQRRQAIAEIVRKHDAYLLEDDAYGYLLSPPLPPVSRLIPERSFFIVSFAKCLAPGLRIAAMIAPEAFRDRSINALRATGWMAVPVMAEVVARLIQNGGLARQAKLKRDKAAVRDAIVRRVLKEWLPAAPLAPGFHTWLPLPAGRTLAALIAQAAQAGITLAPPGRAAADGERKPRRAAVSRRARRPKPTWSGRWSKSGAFLKWPRRFHLFDEYKSVMPGLKREARLRADVPGIHVLTAYQRKRTWMAGTSPAMTKMRDCFYSYFDAPVSRYASGGEFAIRGLVQFGRHRWLRVTSENIPAAVLFGAIQCTIGPHQQCLDCLAVIR